MGTCQNIRIDVFLEMGNPVPRSDTKEVHGQWHALVELCHWRVESQQAMLVGSDDEQELIDGTFANLKLGSIDTANVSSPSHDLRIIFSSGIRSVRFQQLRSLATMNRQIGKFIALMTTCG